MSVVVERRDLRSCREGVISLFDRNGVPYPGRLFEWYYSNAVRHPPISWVLRDRRTDDIVGICSVFPRTLRWGGVELSAGVPGDLLVDSHHRASLGAFGLLRSVQSLIVRKELDVLVGIPSTHVLLLTERLGFRRIGVWESYSLIANSKEALRSRFGGVGAAMSPLVDGAFALLRTALCPALPRYVVAELSRDEVERLHTQDWLCPERCFVSHVSARFLRWRFLNSPLAKYRIFGVTDRQTSKFCGYVAGIESTDKLAIHDCRTDRRVLREADALVSVFRHCKSEGRMFTVESLRSSTTARQLRAMGFVRLPPRRGHESPWLVGYWRPDHWLAAEFGRPSSWSVFRGFNDV